MPYARMAAILASLYLGTPYLTLAQRSAIKPDTVLLSRDLDGSGRADHLVRESRKGSAGEQETRVALYVDVAPETRKPQWATTWNNELPDISLAKSEALSPKAWLLRLDMATGDASFTTILVITRGHVQEDMTLGTSYDEGFSSVRDDGDRHLIEASGSMTLRGKPVTAKLACNRPAVAAMRFAFDTLQLQFKVDKPFCAMPP